MRLWYYWYRHRPTTALDRGTFDFAQYEWRSEAASDRRRTLAEGRWAGPLRSVTIVKDRPATTKKGAKRAR